MTMRWPTDATRPSAPAGGTCGMLGGDGVGAPSAAGIVLHELPPAESHAAGGPDWSICVAVVPARTSSPPDLVAVQAQAVGKIERNVRSSVHVRPPFVLRNNKRGASCRSMLWPTATRAPGATDER